MEKRTAEITIRDLELLIASLEEEKETAVRELSVALRSKKLAETQLKEAIEVKDEVFRKAKKRADELSAYENNLHMEVAKFTEESNKKCRKLEKQELEASKRLIRTNELIDSSEVHLQKVKSEFSGLTINLKEVVIQNKEAEKQLLRTTKKLKEEEDKLSKAVQNKTKILEDSATIVKEASLKAKEAEKDALRHSLTAEKAKREYEDFATNLSTQKHDADKVVSRIEKHYKEAFPHLRFPI